MTSRLFREMMKIGKDAKGKGRNEQVAENAPCQAQSSKPMAATEPETVDLGVGTPAFPAHVPPELEGVEAEMANKRILFRTTKGPATTIEADTAEKGIFWGTKKQRNPLAEYTDSADAVAAMQNSLQESESRPGAFPVDGVNACENSSTSETDSSSSLDLALAMEQQQQSNVGIWVEEGTTLPATLVDSTAHTMDASETDGPTHSNKPDLVDATLLVERPRRRKLSITKASGAAVLVLCFVAVTVLAVVLLGFNDKARLASSDDNPTDSPTHATEMYPPFRDGLLPQTLQHLEDLTTPAFKANKWMVEDPRMHTYSEERQLQRFALAALYFSTSGDNWTRNDHWLNYDVHECDWFFHNDTFGDVCETLEDERGSKRLVGLDLGHNNLHGTLPHEFFYFRNNRFLDLSYNGLYGTIPPLDEDSFTLQVIRISNNALGGMLAVKAGHHPRDLRELDCSNNRFGGQGLNQLALITSLEVIKPAGMHSQCLWRESGLVVLPI